MHGASSRPSIQMMKLKNGANGSHPLLRDTRERTTSTFNTIRINLRHYLQQTRTSPTTTPLSYTQQLLTRNTHTYLKSTRSPHKITPAGPPTPTHHKYHISPTQSYQHQWVLSRTVPVPKAMGCHLLVPISSLTPRTPRRSLRHRTPAGNQNHGGR